VAGGGGGQWGRLSGGRSWRGVGRGASLGHREYSRGVMVVRE
jgi:hypothetical protein